MSVLDLEARELQDFSLFDIDIDMGRKSLDSLEASKN